MTTRPERVPAEEIRQRMLDAGRDLALEAGAALTIEHLRLEEVIQRARVPRSSAYRLWPYKEDYTDDLLVYLAGEGSWFSDRSVLDPGTFAVLQGLLTENQAMMATLAGRRAVLCEIIRVSIERNYHALTQSAQWRLHMALVATLGSTRTGEARRRIATALEEAQAQSRAMLVALFDLLSAQLGLRLRDPSRTVEHMQLAAGLLVQALALRNVQVQAALGDAALGNAGLGDGDPREGDRGEGSPGEGGASATGEAADRDASAVAHVDSLLNVPVPGPGLHGGTADWTLAALGYLGMVDAFAELDPDFVPAGHCDPAPGDSRTEDPAI